MKIITINENGKTFEFICNWRNTRDGFAHDCNLFIDGVERTEAHCYYLNRTWECWPYQTVCLKAINNIYDARMDHLRDQYKAEHNYKKMTSKRTADFEKLLADNDYLKTLQKVIDNLQHNLH